MESKENRFVLFTSASGTGKTTLAKMVASSSDALENAVSATTRPKRNDEVDGKNYHFISKEKFEEMIAANEFIEWQPVYKKGLYGTPYSELERIQQKGKVPLIEIEVAGAKILKEKFGSLLFSVFILPGGEDPLQTLRARLKNRGSETEETLKERLEKAPWEIEQKDFFDTVVVNKDGQLEMTAEKLKNLVEDFLNQ